MAGLLTDTETTLSRQVSYKLLKLLIKVNEERSINQAPSVLTLACSLPTQLCSCYVDQAMPWMHKLHLSGMLCCLLSCSWAHHWSYRAGGLQGITCHKISGSG